MTLGNRADTSLNWLVNISKEPKLVCSQIGSQSSLLKILLKTKDDPYLLSRWIEHHAAIVGYKNLYVFDNGSLSSEVMAIYKHYADKVNIFSFSGFCDVIHKVEAFPDLYRALRDSCRFFTFLDTDEFLVWVDGKEIVTGAGIADRLGKVTNQLVVPGVWLSGLRETENRFWLSHEWLSNGLRWGKPIISSECDLSGFANHNGQLDARLFKYLAVGNCFVLHLTLLLPQQRISTNLNKLIACNVLPEAEPLRHALAFILDDSTLTGNKRQWLAEIQSLSKDKVPDFSAGENLPKDVVELGEDGKVRFHDDEQEATLQDFLSNPRRFASWL